MKICSNCKIEKLETDFSLRPGRKKGKGIRSNCKDCSKKKTANWRLRNPKRAVAKSLEWNKNNPEKFKLNRQMYYERNRERINDQARQRCKIDINYRLRKLLRGRIRDALHGKYKPGSSVRDLGCTVADLKLHLESKFYNNPLNNKIMSWDNLGSWHIDHIKPLSSFNLKNREEFVKACNFTNLQPLWQRDNLSKGAKVL